MTNLKFIACVGSNPTPFIQDEVFFFGFLLAVQKAMSPTAQMAGGVTLLLYRA